MPSAIHCHRRQRSQSESQPVVQEGSGDLQGYSALRWKPEGPERDERLFLRSRCNQSHVMREEQSAGADLRFQPWLCHLTSCGSSDKSLLSASQDFSVIRQTAYVRAPLLHHPPVSQQLAPETPIFLPDQLSLSNSTQPILASHGSGRHSNPFLGPSVSFSKPFSPSVNS